MYSPQAGADIAPVLDSETQLKSPPGAMSMKRE